jgi:hypothetical protein
VRCLHPSNNPRLIRREFFPAWDDPALLDFALPMAASHNVYVGIATRRERRGGKEACAWVKALWAEVDFGEHPAPWEMIERVDEFKRPTMLVHSGGGVHAYYRLHLAVPAVPPDPVEGRLRGICRAVGGDPAATDVCRVLRLPGTLNHKAERLAEFGGPVSVRLLRVAG